MKYSKEIALKGEELRRKAIEYLMKPKRYDCLCKNEKEFQKAVCKGLSEILENYGRAPIRSIREQFKVQVGKYQGIIDIYAIHEDDTTSIIEVKHSGLRYVSHIEQCMAVGQILGYSSIFESHMGFKSELYVIDNKISPFTLLAFQDLSIPVKLIEWQNDKVIIIDLKTI